MSHRLPTLEIQVSVLYYHLIRNASGKCPFNVSCLGPTSVMSFLKLLARRDIYDRYPRETETCYSKIILCVLVENVDIILKSMLRSYSFGKLEKYAKNNVEIRSTLRISNIKIFFPVAMHILKLSITYFKRCHVQREISTFRFSTSGTDLQCRNQF